MTRTDEQLVRNFAAYHHAGLTYTPRVGWHGAVVVTQTPPVPPASPMGLSPAYQRVPR